MTLRIGILAIVLVFAVGCGAQPIDATSDCLDACAHFNDPASECGVSYYDCAAVCDESERIAQGTGCQAETAAFWSCFEASPPGAICHTEPACSAELTTLDACVAEEPSTDCLRACALCGDWGYATCAIGCARRDGHAHLMGCDAEYGAYYACRLAGDSCASCDAENAAFTACWHAFCQTSTTVCPVTP